VWRNKNHKKNKTKKVLGGGIRFIKRHLTT
jgi:hypothetical protein